MMRIRIVAFKRFKMWKPLVILCLLQLPYHTLRAQDTSVHGTVTESFSGTPLPGVNVLIKGTSRGTTTDFDGNYSLSVPADAVLQFSYMGFKTVEKTVNGSTVNVVMEEDVDQLEQVVVIGYGTTTVKDATGSLTSVTSRDFNRGNIVTPENLLSGRVAGLSINTGGEPGAGSSIRIRGGASLGASNDPLIVIDGLPVDNNTIGGSRSVLSTINPNDIESFTVLKDASATAIYGSRASNGVIIIATKKGTQGLKLNLDTRIGVNTLGNTLDVFTGDELREVVSRERPDLLSRLGNANTDWQDEIYRTGISSTQNLSASGSLFGKAPARMSLGRTVQEGLRLTSRFERNNMSVTLNPDFLDHHLKINFNANGSLEKNRFAAGEEGNAITFDPTQPVYDPDSPFGGYFQYYDLNDDGVLNADDLVPNAPVNPVSNLLQNDSRSTVHRIYGNFKIDYQLHFLPEVSAVVNLGYDEQLSDGYVRISDKNPLTQADGRIVGSASTYDNYQRNKLFDGYLEYKDDFGDFGTEITAGYSYQKFESKQYVSGELKDDNPSTAPVLNIDTDLVLIGFFARANLSVKNYLLTLSYRRDGTSRFSKKNRWGNFPAVAFAWKIKEDLFPGLESLSSLKLRLGYGITGQQDIGRDNGDLFLQRYVRGLPASQYQFGSEVISIGIPQFRNENLKWEETSTFNIGLDYGLFDERFNGAVEAFYKESKDLLANAAISDGSNFSNSGYQNVGNFVSRGIEFSLNGDIFRAGDPEDFSWNMNFNATFLDTEIRKLALDQDQQTGDIGGGKGNTIQLHRVGYTPYMFYVYKQVYNAQGKPIEGGYADLDGNNTINNNDRYLFRNGQPDVTMGFRSDMQYRNFDLSFNMRVNLGNHVYNNVNSSRAQYNLLENNSVVSNLPVSVLDTGFRITEDVILSDHYIENASFLKMDNITLGYTFPQFMKGRSTLRISAGVQNVFTITGYSGLDPEVFDNGIDNTIYPRPRTFTVGANISL